MFKGRTVQNIKKWPRLVLVLIANVAADRLSRKFNAAHAADTANVQADWLSRTFKAWHATDTANVKVDRMSRVFNEDTMTSIGR